MPLNKSARELRQGGSDYRCCIPALAGFVRPPSIAPGGEEKFAQDRHRAMAFSNLTRSVVDSSSRSGRHGGHYSSAKRQVCSDPSLVRFVTLRSLVQLALAFLIFLLEQVSPRSLGEHDFVEPSDLE